MASPAINPLNTSPALTPLVGLIIGIVLAFGGATIMIGFGFFILGAIIYFLLLNIKKKPVIAYRYGGCHLLWIILWGIGLGIVTGVLSRPFSLPHDDFSHFSAAQGKIEEISDRTSGDLLKIKVSHLIYTSGKVNRCRNLTILVHTDASPLKPGDVVQFPIELKRITDTPNSFDVGYAKAMERRGILYTQTLESSRVRIVRHSPGLSQRARTIRDRIAGFIESSPLDRKTSYFLNSLLLGDRAYLLPQTKELFVNAGIAHVLALSGMHVGILAAIILFILFPINFTGLFRWRLLLTCLMLWCYAIISGMAPSTVRACIMISIVFFSIFSQRKTTSFNALCVAAIFILIIDPWALFDVGFQLSFICVASIILFVNRLNYVDQRSHGLTHKFVGALLTTLITIFVTWILISYYYEKIPVSFIPANIIILPILPLFLISCLVFMLLQIAGLPSLRLTEFIDGFYYLIEEIARFTGSKGSSILILSPTLFSVLLWMTGIIILAVGLYRSKNKIYIYSGVSLLFVSIIVIPLFQTEGEKENLIICDTFYSVELKMKKGNEEESFIFPAGKTSLWDMNGFSIITLGSTETEESLKNKKLQLLKGRPENKVDIVILTGANRLPLEVIHQIFSPDKIVIHPSVRKTKERFLLSEGDSLSIPIHSLRIHRPLKLCVCNE